MVPPLPPHRGKWTSRSWPNNNKIAFMINARFILRVKMKEKKLARRGVEKRKRESKMIDRIKKNDDVVPIEKGNNKK